MKFVIPFLLLACCAATLRIEDYGGIGDAIQTTCSTTSNSTTIITSDSFSSSDVGKLAMVFGVGAVTSGTNRQDLITTIASAVGTSLTLSTAPTLTANGVSITIGTNNQSAFQAVVNACVNTNDTINIKSGTYLIVPPAQLTNYVMSSAYDGQPAVVIRRGGITFYGTNNPTILSCGAWKLMPYTHRGFTFEVLGPVTNDYPLVFNGITFDGGVFPGNQTNTGFPASTVDGAGWDVTHSAFLDANKPIHSHKVFTNCTFIHWRGEILKSVSDYTNCYNEILNCAFSDGDASALNLTGAYNINGCLFTNLALSLEWYQGYAWKPSLISSNTIYAPISIVGALGNFDEPQVMISDNHIFSHAQLSPAANLVFSNNFFAPQGGYPYGILSASAGYQGSDS